MSLLGQKHKLAFIFAQLCFLNILVPINFDVHKEVFFDCYRLRLIAGCCSLLFRLL